VPPPRLAALEFTVAELAPCLALFGGVLGLEVSAVCRHPTIDADVAQVVAGDVLINLLCPTDTGSGTPLAKPEPRLSQLNFGLGAPDELGELRSRCQEGGAAVVAVGDQLFYLDSQMTTGLLGADATLVFSSDQAAEGGQDG